MSRETVAVVRGIYEAFGQGDVPAVLGMFDGDIEWHEAEGMPYGGTYRGPEQVAAKVFAPIVEDVEGFGVGPEEFLESAEEVVALGHYSGTGKRTGTDFTIPFAHAWTVRNGKAVRFRQYVDTAKFNEAIGATANA